eukprot:5351388-Prymnesium_polylepis.1
MAERAQLALGQFLAHCSLGGGGSIHQYPVHRRFTDSGRLDSKACNRCVKPYNVRATPVTTTLQPTSRAESGEVRRKRAAPDHGRPASSSQLCQVGAQLT